MAESAENVKNNRSGRKFNIFGAVSVTDSDLFRARRKDPVFDNNRPDFHHIRYTFSEIFFPKYLKIPEISI